jgi:hypothetical protein
MIAKPEGHGYDINVCDVSVAGQAKHFDYVGHHFIPT